MFGEEQGKLVTTKQFSLYITAKFNLSLSLPLSDVVLIIIYVLQGSLSFAIQLHRCRTGRHLERTIHFCFKHVDDFNGPQIATVVTKFLRMLLEQPTKQYLFLVFRFVLVKKKKKTNENRNCGKSIYLRAKSGACLITCRRCLSARRFIIGVVPV